MDEAGAQVAPPIFIHRALPGRYCESPITARKRDHPYHQVQSLNYQPQDPQHSSAPPGNWNPNSWEWNSTRFVAKPVESEILRLGLVNSVQNKRAEEAANGSSVMSKTVAAGDEDDEGLRLNLGGGLKSLEEPISRPNKRVRSGSPSSNYPMCQVDDCSEDLSSAKDYHRRHKVCEGHSKAAKAIVGKQMQRFCQQCSRFHPLAEFDEGKRSCRRRLAGHNRRRRKTQAEDANSRVLSPGVKDANGDANLDVVNLLTAITRAQGTVEDKNINTSSIPDREQILQILSNINAFSLPSDIAAKLASYRNLNGATLRQAPMDHANKSNGAVSSPSTMDLLTVLSATLLSQKGGQTTEFEKSKPNNFSDLSADPKGPGVEITSVGGERSSSSYHSPVEESDCHVLETRSNLPLQLFSSSPESSSLPKLPPSRKYFSSGSSNRTEEQSPSSSPVVQRLFPMQASVEEATRPEISIIREVNEDAETNRDRAHIASLELFRDYDRGPARSPFQSSPYQAGYTSSSGSDHSPSSLSLDSQERTGRIMFKLFDKDPSHLPGSLRSQVFNWLSSSPLEMESYIRPGCLVLSIYLSMPSTAWEQLEENLLERLNALLQGSESEFWRTGRFLMHTGRKFASHINGKVHLLKSLKASSPELISVSPLALAVGQEITQLVLQGRNLVNPGTKIHCTYMGGYISKEVDELSCGSSVYDEIRVTGFGSNDGGLVPRSLGRCFIEVENGFKGHSFPLIIADPTICDELRTLESELREDKSSSRGQILHFLNELGWLFQRRKGSSPLDPDYSLRRIKLLLTFSVERDWCYLVRNILDILAESNFDGSVPTKESLEALAEVQLLNRSVRRGCTKMVELLINYAVKLGPDAPRTYIFPPNAAGPGGITPLHLAACTSGSTNTIDALTNDPQEIGLSSWSTLLDASGHSAHSYAAMRNNHSYNELVARKLSDRMNGQISLEIEGSDIVAEQENSLGVRSLRQRSSCARCSVAAATKPYGTRMAGSQGVLHRPYIHSMLVVAAVCVCVCLLLRGAPKVGCIPPFSWKNLNYGAI